MAKAKKANHSTEFIQKEAQEDGNLLLANVFNSIRKFYPELSYSSRPEEDQNDKGIDFQYELINKVKGETFDLIKIQNKGTNEALEPLRTTENKGLISFQLSVKHARYYRRQLPLVMIFTVCDIPSQKVYWHPIQLDDTIDQRAYEAEQKGTDSIQIYIDPERQLKVDTFRLFSGDVEKSYREQNSRFLEFRDNPITDLATELQFDPSKTLLDQLYHLIEKLYEDIRFVPIHLLIRNYPFKKATTYIPHYSRFSVSTDNEELMDLLESIQIKDDNTLEFKNLDLVSTVDNYEDKATTILKKLTQNQIYWIVSEKNRKSIFIRCVSNFSCLCINCQLSRLDILKTITGLDVDPDDLQESMKYAYTHYQLGSFIKAAKLFQTIAIRAKKEEKHIVYIITQFNLVKLGRFISNNYWETEPVNLGKDLLNIDLDKVKHLYGHIENPKLFTWIKEQKFINEAQNEIQSLAGKIRDDYQRHLRGDWSSNNNIDELISAYGQLSSFINGNFIVYDKFSEYAILTEAFTEALFASYSTRETQGKTLENFNDWIIQILIFEGNYTIIRKYFNKYLLKSIRYQSNKEDDGLLLLLKNLLLNNHLVTPAFEKYAEEETRFFRNKYQNIFCNTLVLAAILDFTDFETEQICNYLISCLSHGELYTRDCYQQLNFFISLKSKQLCSETIKSLLILSIEKVYLQDEERFEILTEALSKKGGYISLCTEQERQLLALAFETDNEVNFDIAVNFYPIAEEQFKTQIKNKMISNLELKYSPYNYYVASILDILPISTAFFQSFIVAAQPRPDQLTMRKIFHGEDDNRFRLLDMLLNLCFKYQINLLDVTELKFKGFSDYYDWLLDMQEFNYNKFKVKWLSLYTTKFYFIEFRKHPVIKNKLAEHLKSNRDPQMERIFYDLYSGIENISAN